MRTDTPLNAEALLSGANSDEGLVALELRESKGQPDRMVLFFRRGAATQEVEEPFTPFLVAAPGALDGCPVEGRIEALAGEGALKVRALYSSWKDCVRARTWLADRTGASASAPDAPYLFVNDPVQQHRCSRDGPCSRAWRSRTSAACRSISSA